MENNYSWCLDCFQVTVETETLKSTKYFDNFEEAKKYANNIIKYSYTKLVRLSRVEYCEDWLER